MNYNKVEHPAFGKISAIKSDFKHNKYVNGFNSFSDFLNALLKKALFAQRTDTQYFIDLTDAVVINGIYKRYSTHYFIETVELFDFLSDMEIKDETPLEKICDQNNLFDMLAESLDGRHPQLHVGHIHYLNNEESLSFVFWKTVGEKYITLSLMRNNDISFYGNGLNIIGIYDKMSKEGNVDYSPEKVIQDTQLVINMFLYMEAFPDSITTKAPAGQPMQYDDNHSRIIKTHSSLLEHGTISPHFRRGHFRRLESERFTKKRGRVIFVHSTFVKGHAKTILDNSDKENTLGNSNLIPETINK